MSIISIFIIFLSISSLVFAQNESKVIWQDVPPGGLSPGMQTPGVKWQDVPAGGLSPGMQTPAVEWQDTSQGGLEPDIGWMSLLEPLSKSSATNIGEPKVTYNTPLGYAPATAGPLTIKKTVTGVETGNGHANRLRVDVEITSARKNRNDDAINDIDMYELVDESLNLVPPSDKENETIRLDDIEQLKDNSYKKDYVHFSEVPLINFQKASSLEQISLMRQALLHDRPLSSAGTKSYRKVYGNPDSEDQLKYYIPISSKYNIFKLSKITGIDANDSKNIENLSEYLEEDFGVNWINSSNLNITYPEYSNNLKIIELNDNNDSNNWISFRIDDHDKYDGIAIMNISEKVYFLEFETDKTNNSWWNISDQNEVMRFHVKRLGSKDRLFYWYYVRPKKSGTFNTESIIRINDEYYRGWPDIIYPLNIEVGKPDYRFEVDPILEDSKAYVDTNFVPSSWWGLNVTYIIRYKGEASNTYLKNIKIELKPDKGCRLDDNKSIEYKIFNKENNYIAIFDKKIIYNKTGVNRIPPIWIEDTPYIFKETVTVDDPILRWWEIINSYYTIFAALFLILVNKELKGILGWIYDRVLSAFAWLGYKKKEPQIADIKSDSEFHEKEIKGVEPEKEETTANKDTTARDEAAKKMADIIIDALERGTKEKR
jgi:hypothetical protein